MDHSIPTWQEIEDQQTFEDSFSDQNQQTETIIIEQNSNHIDAFPKATEIQPF